MCKLHLPSGTSVNAYMWFVCKRSHQFVLKPSGAAATVL